MRLSTRKSLPLLVLLAVALFAACQPTPVRMNRPDPPGAPSNTPPEITADARVTGIADGDTLTVVLTGSGKQERVRLATIDAPEMNQPYGPQAKKSLSDLVMGKEVRLVESGRDRYGRLIAEVFVGVLNINVEQLRRGFAWHYKQHANEQNPQQRMVYSAAESNAKQAGFGLWRDQNPVAPWDWRAKDRRQETGDRRQETGDGRQETGDGRREAVNSTGE